MPYIICNGGKYIQQTPAGIVITTDQRKATKWNKADSAKNVCKNISNNKIYGKYHMSVKYVSGDTNKKEKKPTKVCINEKQMCYISQKITELSGFVKELEERKAELEKEINKAELEIVDIEHAAEFYRLNAADGYKLYKLLHDVRVRRRAYKDEVYKIEVLLGSPLTAISLKSAEDHIANMENRKYSPRVNKALFGE